MYSPFPLGINDYKQSKVELNQFSGSEVKEALSKNAGVISKIISEASPDGYLTKALMGFMNQIIRSEVTLDDKPGDAITEKLEDLYHNKSAVSQREEELIERANEFDPADTIPEDIAEALQAHLRVETSKNFIARDDKTKSFEKAMFLGLFNDFTRLNKAQNPNNLNLKQIQTASGSTWDYLGDSFVGGHTLAVNSDSYKVNNGSNNLLGVIADGVTTSPGTPLDYFGGHNLSKILTKNVQNSNFQNFRASSKEPSSKADLQQDELRAWTHISKNIIDFFAELDQANFKYNPQENFFDQATQFLEETGKPDHAKAIQEESLKDAITAMAPFYGIVKDLSSKLKESYPELERNIGLASTLQYAVELGDKIVTVKLGDSDVACYGTNGKKLKPGSKFTQEVIKSPSLESSLSKPNNYFGVKIDQNADIREVSIPPVFVNQDGSTYLGNHYIGELSVSVYDKKDVDQVLITSDGCLENGTNLAEDIHTDPKQNFIDLISHNDSDDKTALVFKKAS